MTMLIESEISTESFLKLINESKAQLCLVDFYADWCEPCKWLSEILDGIIPDIEDLTQVIKIDIDKSPQLKAHFNINSAPVLMLFKKGEAVWRINGFLSATDLKKKIESFID